MQDATSLGEPPDPHRPRLQVEETSGRRIVAIERLPFSIGRRSLSDLVLVDPDVSRDHAEIVDDRGNLLLKDRSSRFGTFVNGQQISEHRLEPNDRIAFGRGGRTELIYLPVDASVISSAGQSGLGGDLHQIAVLLEALRGMGSGRVLDEVLALVLDSAIELTGAERGFIMLANAAGGLDLKLARAEGKITMPLTGFTGSRKVPEEVFATGQLILHSDIQEQKGQNKHQDTMALGIRQVLCAPLRLVRILDKAEEPSEPRNIGVLYLDSRERGKLVSKTVQTALEALASEAGSAIENARLYRETLEKARLDQELRTAAEIQQALLPQPHRSGAFYEAMGSSMPCRSVGGDFFDYFDPPSGGFAFALGDVAGKGPPAALLAAVLQGILTGQAQSDARPSDMMTRINNALVSRGVESRFATAFFGHLTPDGVLSFCNAGHNPPFVFSQGGLKRLETGGMILGLFPGATYDEESIQLLPGDVVVVFSDGVSEAASSTGEEFGDDRIRSSVEGVLRETTEDIQKTLLLSVRDFTRGAVQNDDITAIVVAYQPVARRTPG